MFDNRTIKGPIAYRPHICIRDGYWRVSAMPKKAYETTTERSQWFDAYMWATRANNQRVTDHAIKLIKKSHSSS